MKGNIWNTPQKIHHDHDYGYGDDEEGGGLFGLLVLGRLR